MRAPIPTVVFPIIQEDIKAKSKELSDHLRALQSEERMVSSMIAELKRWCSHPNAKNSCCVDCGADWGD